MSYKSNYYSCVLMLFFISFTAACEPQNKTKSTETESIRDDLGMSLNFDESSKLISIQVTADEIGFVAKPKQVEKATSALKELVSLKRVTNLSNDIYIAQLGERLTKQKLFELAYVLAEEEAVSNAGVVVYSEKGEVPIIVTNGSIVQFSKNASDDDIDAHLRASGLEPMAENPFAKGRQILVRVKPEAGRNSVTASREMNEKANVEFSHPDFIRVIDYRQFTPNDTLYANQWHHNNQGISSGTIDADGDTDFAWTITRGIAATSIAVLDSGFDIAHEDLTANIVTNVGEIAGNGVDDDANGCIDDVNGCTFAVTMPCSPGSMLTCGTGAITAANHGTSVAGVAAARGHNALGVSGACHNCTIIPIQQGSGTFIAGLSIGYAGSIGADVFTNSWGYADTFAIPANITTAINNTAATGAVILWAMNNGNINDCTGTPDISANANAIAISASSNQDRKVTESAFGNCMELLAPTHRGYGGGTAFTGTLNITTTDRTGSAGYNNTNSPAAPCPAEVGDNNYTNCFGGTSSATPYAAGIAGLMLSATPGLTRQQVQRSLQDTADKIQDSAGSYSDSSGFSAPGGAATHGYGRVNAFEAVRLVAPTAVGGRNNVDIFLRDNRLDWGNTEQLSNVLMEPTRGYIPHYQSVDIKIDAGPSFEPSPPTTSAEFDAFVDEDPVSGEVNRVYVRVHNRGATTAAEVTVKLQWAFAGTALPALPSDYWAVFPGDSAVASNPWNPLGTQTISNLQYSGASIAGTAADGSQIAAFDFTGPAIDSSLSAFRHHCLLAVISSPQDPVLATSMSQFAPDVITPRDNNVTHKNVSVQDPIGRDGKFRAAFFVRNPFKNKIRTRLQLIAPRGWKAELEGLPLNQVFELEAFSEKQVIAEFFAPNEGATGRVEIRQMVEADEKVKEVTLGGVIYDFQDKKKPEKPYINKGKDSKSDVKVYPRGDGA